VQDNGAELDAERHAILLRQAVAHDEGAVRARPQVAVHRLPAQSRAVPGAPQKREKKKRNKNKKIGKGEATRSDRGREKEESEEKERIRFNVTFCLFVLFFSPSCFFWVCFFSANQSCMQSRTRALSPRRSVGGPLLPKASGTGGSRSGSSPGRPEEEEEKRRKERKRKED
jgi:hypothetical protein